MLVWLGTIAAAATLALPPDAAIADWTAPARLAGLTLVSPGEPGDVVCVASGDGWNVRVEGLDGSVRSERIAVPRRPEQREDAVWLAASLLAEVDASAGGVRPASPKGSANASDGATDGAAGGLESGSKSASAGTPAAPAAPDGVAVVSAAKASSKRQSGPAPIAQAVPNGVTGASAAKTAAKPPSSGTPTAEPAPDGVAVVPVSKTSSKPGSAGTHVAEAAPDHITGETAAMAAAKLPSTGMPVVVAAPDGAGATPARIGAEPPSSGTLVVTAPKASSKPGSAESPVADPVPDHLTGATPAKTGDQPASRGTPDAEPLSDHITGAAPAKTASKPPSTGTPAAEPAPDGVAVGTVSKTSSKPGSAETSAAEPVPDGIIASAARPQPPSRPDAAALAASARETPQATVTLVDAPPRRAIVLRQPDADEKPLRPWVSLGAAAVLRDAIGPGAALHIAGGGASGPWYVGATADLVGPRAVRGVDGELRVTDLGVQATWQPERRISPRASLGAGLALRTWWQGTSRVHAAPMPIAAVSAGLAVRAGPWLAVTLDAGATVDLAVTTVRVGSAEPWPISPWQGVVRAGLTLRP